MADVEKGKTREEEYVPAEYVAAAEADEHAKGGGRWSQVCDWPLAFREALEVFEIKSIKEDACCVKFNPLCWLLVALITLINILGKIVHAPADQARQLRADETALERKVRIEWVYLTDGGFVLNIIMYLLTPIKGSYGYDTLLAIIISVVFIAGNIAFLRAVRNKYAIGVRTAIIANTMFVVALTAILILWLIVRSTSEWKVNRYITFITRVLVLVLLWYDLRQFKAIAAMYPLDDKWPGFFEMLGRSLAGLLLVALFFLALVDSGSRLAVLKAVLG